MRRSPIVLSATIAGTAGVLAFHPHAQASQATTVRTAAATPAATSTAKSASTPAGSGTATGDPIATRYGDVQVRVTVRKGKIVTIDALQLTADDPRSAQISAYAAPQLQQEALSTQSAAIDAISGATYTSAAYAQSLQSALDKLGFKAADGSRATLQVPA
jgi:uncharacterized protein with FMN-binding domain